MIPNRQWLALVVALAALAALLGVGFALAPDIRPVGPGKSAPEIEAVNVYTGETVRLADYSGNVVLLNIWATWCPPCEQEMPALQRLHDTLGPEGLRVVAVSIDQASSDYVREWTEERNLTFDILQDKSGRIERRYQTTGLPESFVIDTSGTIMRKEIGAQEWDDAVHIAFLRRLLGSP